MSRFAGFGTSDKVNFFDLAAAVKLDIPHGTHFSLSKIGLFVTEAIGRSSKFIKKEQISQLTVEEQQVAKGFLFWDESSCLE